MRVYVINDVHKEVTVMIDLHAHILPGFDDGPASLPESLQMAKAYVQAGYTQVVATPHVIPGLYQHTRQEIIEGVQDLQTAIQTEGIELAVWPGAEYYLTTDLPHTLAKGELLTVNDNGKYLLVELPTQEVPPYTSQVLFELMLAGITPVLVHPERNSVLASHPEMLAEMVQKGILAQVTAGCLTGLFGHTARSVAHFFINKGFAQLIASDAHGPGRRLAAGPEAARLLGVKSQYLMSECPATVLSGCALAATACSAPTLHRRNWLKGIFTRIRQ